MTRTFLLLQVSLSHSHKCCSFLLFGDSLPLIYFSQFIDGLMFVIHLAFTSPSSLPQHYGLGYCQNLSLIRSGGGVGGYVFKYIWENLNPVNVGVLLVLLSLCCVGFIMSQF